MDYSNILHTAVQYANKDYRKPSWLDGDIFYMPTSTNKLEIWYDTNTVKGAIAVAKTHGYVESEEEVYNTLVEIVQDSVQTAITAHGGIFAAIIIENIRSGGDIFGDATRTDN